MRIILHSGAHFTDEDRLIRTLLRNADALARQGIGVPAPGRYRRLLRSTFAAMVDHAPAEDSREVLLDAILDGAEPQRLILSNAHLFGTPRSALRQGILYPKAAERLHCLQRLFPGDRFELFMALRDLACFLPAGFAESPKDQMKGFTGVLDMREIRWSELILRLRTQVPDIPLTLWCSEDSPFLWGEIMRRMAGLAPDAPIEGTHSLIHELLTDEGVLRLTAYLARHPEINTQQQQRVLMAFLDRYGRAEALEEELDAPGWTEEMVDTLSTLYDEDVERIRAIPGITFLMP